ncbi:hypothetical protein FS837_010945 [Tulasnella sp. UAMH 9824]|nr:hypothetical protein FS837_010945 [Tulasnella sp. UAMH 9824]
MDRAPESPRDQTKDIVAGKPRRGTSPAISPSPDYPIGLDLIDEHLRHAWASRDELLIAINLKVLALKSQRNLHASIHRLPVELLVYIFRLSLPAPETGPHYMQFLATLLSVCKHWATMISAASSLWAVVTSMCSPDLLASSLARLNSTCPLHIVCTTSSDEEFTRILHQISPHIHRWETADIVMPQTEEGRQYLSTPAPTLRRLHLSIPPGTAVDDANFQPFDIFNGSADRLEELKVSWACLPWDSALLRRLGSLHLERCEPIRVSNVVDILNDCPDLATLIIYDMVIIMDLQVDPSKAVNMTRLETIQFTVAALDGIQEVINAFNAPNCKAVKFFHAPADPDEAKDFILTTLAPYFPFCRRMMFERPRAVIDVSNLDHFHIQCPLQRYEEDFVGFSLQISATPSDIAADFLREVLRAGESQKPDVRLILGRDWGTEGLSILEEVSTYCNVVDLWLGAYAMLRDFDTEHVLRYLAQPVVIPNLRHLIISGDGWNGAEVEAILRRRYNQESGNGPHLRIRLIGRGVNANVDFAEDLEAIPMIECAVWNEWIQLIDNDDV